MSSDTPLVSIITPLYNSEDWVEDMVLHVSKQSYRNYEHICIDDSSSDNTVRNLTRAYNGDNRLRLIKLNKNLGPGSARNIGLGQAKGRFIAFLDADDMWLPNKLEVQVEFMLKHRIGFSYHDYRHISADGLLHGRLIKAPQVLNWNIHHLSRKVGCLTVVIDKENVSEIIFPTIQRGLKAEDFLAWSKILLTGVEGRRIAMDLGRYRLSPSSHSSNKFKTIYSVWTIYRRYENIGFFKSLIFFISYLVSALAKHAFCRPNQRTSAGPIE